MINYRIMLSISAVECLSIISFLFPDLMPAAFLAVCVLAACFIIKDLKYGLYFLFAELFIGSLGYLFWLDAGGFRISIRIALWTLFMVIWLLKSISKSDFKELYRQSFKPGSMLFYCSVLFVFVIWGVLNAAISSNNPKLVFFDLNGWVYFGLIYPAYYIMAKTDLSKLLAGLKEVFFASVVWLAAKSLLLLYLFSHNFKNILPSVYRWVRDTRVGEITQMNEGFVRIFFQSFIFVLAGAFVYYLMFLKPSYKNTVSSRTKYLFSASILFSVVILSFSRSNWIGLAFGGLLILYIIWRNIGFRIAAPVAQGAAILLIGFLLSTAIMNFPFPSTKIEADAASLVKDRAVAGEEAGASSRWSLLPAIWNKIEQSPLLGSGFGSTVTYVSYDPRVRESNPTGEYTTYAVEWGWLDIWSKLGGLGLLSYIVLINAIFKKGWPVLKKAAFSSDLSVFISGILAGLAALFIINIFSPYFNHPLGIGYLIFSIIFVEGYWYVERLPKS